MAEPTVPQDDTTTTSNTKKISEMQSEINRALNHINSFIESQELLTICLENLSDLDECEQFSALRRVKVLIQTYTFSSSRQMDDIYTCLMSLKKLG